MRVTVCELSNDPDRFIEQWHSLMVHVRSQQSELVLLPEMPFYPWIARNRDFHPSVWEASMKAHNAWLKNLADLSSGRVLGTRPVNKAGRRLNEGFIWEPRNGYRAIHSKYYLPDEAQFWEASWYDRGSGEFKSFDCLEVEIGFLICTEMWFGERARRYADAGIHLLACPRATPMASSDKWIAGGRVAAVLSGAFCLSSNRGGTDKHGMVWAGKGWIIEPEEGDILALTSPSQPFITVDIDLGVADRAKQTYPRYIVE